MKKILLLIFSTFTIFTAAAQNAPVDFETPGNGATWTWTVFENDSNPALEIIPNPDDTGANTSATVAKFTALQLGQPFAGCETMHGADIGTFTLDATTSTIRIMVWKSVVSDVGIKLVEAGAGSLGEIKVANTLMDQWEELSFDFSSMEGIEYDQIVVFPDFDARTQDNVVYFDNISFGAASPIAAPMVAAPVPTIDPANVISMFSNAYTDVPVDTWLTPWSAGNLNDIQIVGDDTKQYTSVNFVGIETVGANLIDASSMEYFNIDVWTPNMTTFRIKLVDFGADAEFGGGDDTEQELVYENHAQNTWVTYQIPLADFTGLTSVDHLAQLILSGLPAGGGILYVDNVYYSNNPTSIDEPVVKQIELFPNPAGSSLSIRTDGDVEGIQIYDLLGKIVVDEKVSGSVSSLNIDRLLSGAYVLIAIVDGERVVERFVKK